MKSHSRDNLLNNPNLHTAAVPLFRGLIAMLRAAGYPAVIVEGYRSAARQRALYAQGRTNAALQAIGYTADEIKKHRGAGYTADKRVVTKTLSSMHTRGRAIDIAFIVEGKITYNVPESYWTAIGTHAKKIGLVWGGDWSSFPDKCHVEYRGE